MDFPDYVPPAVRRHISLLVDGDEREPQGWAAALADAQSNLDRIDRAIEGKTRRGETEYLASLWPQKAKAKEHRDALAREVACCHRLAQDLRMRDAYAILASELSSDDQWRAFIGAARAALIDYGGFRERLKRATELKNEIADAADKLRILISQFANTGVVGPSEFYSVRELLRQTDNHEMQDHNLHMWRSMRKHVLGDLPSESRALDQNTPNVTRVVIVPMSRPTEPDPLAALQYGWGTAPDFPELLRTVANAARQFVPSEPGIIGAALSTRQSSIKTEYLRAFGSSLTHSYGLEITPSTMRAMATVANVVLDQPGIDVTPDDVRKALKQLSTELKS